MDGYRRNSAASKDLGGIIRADVVEVMLNSVWKTAKSPKVGIWMERRLVIWTSVVKESD